MRTRQEGCVYLFGDLFTGPIHTSGSISTPEHRVMLLSIEDETLSRLLFYSTSADPNKKFNLRNLT